MNVEKILEELRREVESIDDAIAALQKLMPAQGSSKKNEDSPAKPESGKQ